jgi:type VI secretion system VasD/TssJ family lipoprotein
VRRQLICLPFLVGGCSLRAPALSSGTAAKATPVPEPVSRRTPERLLALRIEAGVDANPGSGGRPSPIVVRVYLLRARAQFDGADFFGLYGNEQGTLADSLLSRDELQLVPGQVARWEAIAPATCRFVGVAAAFRRIEQARWRSVVELPPPPDDTGSPAPARAGTAIRIRIAGPAITAQLDRS